MLKPAADARTSTTSQECGKAPGVVGGRGDVGTKETELQRGDGKWWDRDEGYKQ